jgi:hypothetical protein
MTNRINLKMLRSKLTDLSSELPKDYVLSHYNTGGIWHLEITKESYDKNMDLIDHIHIVTSYSGTISETYHTIRVLYDVVHNIKEIEN